MAKKNDRTIKIKIESYLKSAIPAIFNDGLKVYKVDFGRKKERYGLNTDLEKLGLVALAKDPHEENVVVHIKLFGTDEEELTLPEAMNRHHDVLEKEYGCRVIQYAMYSPKGKLIPVEKIKAGMEFTGIHFCNLSDAFRSMDNLTVVKDFLRQKFKEAWTNKQKVSEDSQCHSSQSETENQVGDDCEGKRSNAKVLENCGGENQGQILGGSISVSVGIRDVSRLHSPRRASKRFEDPILQAVYEMGYYDGCRQTVIPLYLRGLLNKKEVVEFMQVYKKGERQK